MLVINQYAKTWSNWLSVSWLFKNLEKKLILSTRSRKRTPKIIEKSFWVAYFHPLTSQEEMPSPSISMVSTIQGLRAKGSLSAWKGLMNSSLNKGGKMIIWCYRPAITYEFSQYEWDTHKFQPVCPIWSVQQPTLYGPHKYTCYSERTRPAEFKERSIIESKHIVPIKLPLINF